jgi:nitrile hydratase
MNTIHDMGGMHGFGPVVAEENEPVFHDEWERRVLGVMIATSLSGRAGFDRSYIERIDPTEYLATSYYEHWLRALETQLLEIGVVTQAELGAGHLASPSRRDGSATPAKMEQIWPWFQRGMPLASKTNSPRFKVGDSVVARNINPHHHTRLPRYARGKPAKIIALRGAFPLPDAQAQGLGTKLEEVYTVRFDARDLWGADAELRSAVHLEMYDSYLDPT